MKARIKNASLSLHSVLKFTSCIQCPLNRKAIHGASKYLHLNGYIVAMKEFDHTFKINFPLKKYLIGTFILMNGICSSQIKAEFQQSKNYSLNSESYFSGNMSNTLSVKPSYFSSSESSNKIFETIKEKISPILAYKTGGTIINNGDSIFIRSVELGCGLTFGDFNEWESWGILPMGYDWGYITLPLISAEYRWFNTIYDNPSYAEPTKLKHFMLNLGVTGGRGFIVTLLPVPIGINGFAGISTDFQDLYIRGRIGWDVAWVSIGVGGYYNLTRKSSSTNNRNYVCAELTIHPWRVY